MEYLYVTLELTASISWQRPQLTQEMTVLKHTSVTHKWADRDSQPQPGSRVKGSLGVRGK